MGSCFFVGEHSGHSSPMHIHVSSPTEHQRESHYQEQMMPSGGHQQQEGFHYQGYTAPSGEYRQDEGVHYTGYAEVSSKVI